MPGSLLGFIEDLVTPHDRDLRAFCVRNLNQEVVRTRNEAFGAVRKFHPAKAYQEDFRKAEFACQQGWNHQWPSHTYLELPFHWLNLMGFRLAVERGLVMGGLGAVKTVAAVELGLSRGETEQWTVELLFNVYCDTKLREQWDYEGFRFRLNEQAKQIEYC